MFYVTTVNAVYIHYGINDCIMIIQSKLINVCLDFNIRIPFMVKYSNSKTGNCHRPIDWLPMQKFWKTSGGPL